MPTGAVFVDSGNGAGSFDWTPDFTQSNTYTVTFYATDDSSAADSEVVTITVNQVNLDPVLASIGSQNVDEGANLNFGVSATDADGTIPVMTTSTLPTGAVFVDSGNGAGSFDWTPDFTQSNTYNVTFYATDDSSAVDSEVVTITVNNVNQTPVLAAIGSQNVDEGVNLNFGVSATDADGTTPVLTTSTLPAGASFTDYSNGTGGFNWTPDFTQSNTYDVTFYATDDSSAVDSEVVTITVVEAGNQLPILASIGAQSTTENINLNFVVSATDADGPAPVLTTSTLPTGAGFTDNGDGTGTFDWTPDFLQSGVYNITFYATDDSSAVDSEIVAVTVNDAGNQLPVLATIGPQSTTEGIQLVIPVSATDAESTPTFNTSALPSGANFTDNGNGTGSFDWTPDYLQSGVYNITFYAADDSASVDSELVVVTVNEAGNQIPVLATIGAQSTTENVNLNFVISATDAEGAIPVLTSSTLPSGADFADNSDGTGTFDWTPLFIQSGVYNVTFYATDDSSAVDSEVVSITVIDAGNQNPVMAPISPKSTTEGVNVAFAVSAADPDSTIPALSTGILPNAASFIDNGNGTGNFSWTPLFNQSGTYHLVFYATDDTLGIDSQIATITVVESGNHAPILSSIGNRSTTEGINLNFVVSAVDPDSTVPTVTTTALPTGATFVNNGDGSHTFNWTPGFTQAGSYNITFYASDGGAVDSELIYINVFEAGNQPPTLASIGNRSVAEGVNLSFSVSATDPDSTNPVLSTSTLPGGAAFVNNGNGSGDFDWTPGFNQSGSYNITFYATDGIITDSEVVVITVQEAGNQPPVLAAIGPQGIPEGSNLNFSVSATDADGTIPTLSTSTLPTGATFTDHGNGSGTFDWTPDFTQDGIYLVTFYAGDGLATDSEVVTITVADQGNQPPTLASIGSRSTTEGVLLSFGVSATDPDSTIPTLSTSALPTGADFTDNGDGTGDFNWTPGYTQSGVYPITFYASDGVIVDSEVVSITVNEAGNQAPILATIGSHNTTEGINLNFIVSAADPDSTTPVLTTSTLPGGASYIDNGDGTGTFDWTPGYTQSGSYLIIFYATDAAFEADSEIVSITVNEAGNQSPVLVTIGAQSVTEGNNLNFAVSATDPDGTIPSLSTSTLPGGATFNNNGNGTGSFNWTPDFTQSGSYDVTFYAFDGAATDSEIVTITVVEAGNQPPVLTAIGTRVVTEGVELTIGVSASDPDGTIPTLDAISLPIGASFIDNGDGTGTFDWIPNYIQTGTYVVNFRAYDGLVTDSELVTISVIEAGNQPPVLAVIGPQTTTENILLSFGIFAADPDSTTPTLTTSTLPTGASFVDNGNGTGSFDWTPGFTQSGNYSVTFYASDGLVRDSEIVSITVIEAGNQPPVLASIGAQTTTENVLLSFGVSATDPDGTTPLMSTSVLPSGASFIDNGNGTGSFNWTPTFVQAGLYSVTFYADDGLILDSEVVLITVVEAGNQPPNLATIGSKITTEGINLDFSVSASDPDETTPALSTSTLPSGALFTDNGNGTGNFDWTPGYTQSGTYYVTFYASDGSLVDSEVVTISVTEAGNQLPVLAPIGPHSTNENVLLSFSVSASDPDGTTPTLSTSILPTGASFVNNGNGTGDFNWTPDFTQSGSYQITFYASDGLAIDSERVSITVNEEGNQAPVLASIGPRNTTEGTNLNFTVSASDPDATTPNLSTSTLPSGAAFVDNLNGTGTFNWTPLYTQAGIYPVTFYASDGAEIDSEIVTITVSEAGNQAPTLAAIGARSILEGGNLNFAVSATDPDSTIPTLTTSTLPTGASFVDNSNGTGIFNWTPNYTQSGTYYITFYADDGVDTDSEVVTITVNEAGNQAPILSAIGPRSTIEGNNLNFGVSASDPDGISPTLSTSTLPTGASFINNGNGTGTFDWTPAYTQSGTYFITFYATDGAAIDSEVVSITVNEAGNQAPILAAIGPRNTTEGIPLSFGVSASDPDGVIPSLNTSTLPGGASFVNNGNGTGSFNWTPDYTQSGSYPVTFYATDGAATDSEVVTITVNEAGNQIPVLATIGSKATTEGVLLSFGISASDPDGTIPILSSSTVPTGAVFVNNGDGTGSFNWTPNFTQSGTYNITFYATDGLATDSEIVSISVSEAGNQSPALASIGSRITTEGINLGIAISAVDPDGTIPNLTTSTLPSGASFINNGDGTGNFDWTPDFTQAGLYNITFYASDGVLIDSETITITVIEAGNQTPVLAAIGARSTTEGISLYFTISATDPDGTTPVLITSSLPSGVIFTDNHNGTGSFDWTPGFTQAGSYSITFYASDGVLVDSEQVAITVFESGNQAPVLATIGSRSVTEGINLTFGISSSDPDGTTPSLSTSTLPTGANFTDNGNGTGTFNWTPGFTQVGTYYVTFYASDGALIDSEIVTITVFEAGNQYPVLATIGPRSTTEGINLNFNISATDPDGTIPALIAVNVPTGATFVNNGNGTGTFDWTPNYTQSGSYFVTFIASDGIAADSEIVTISVGEAGNQSPVLATIGPRNVTEGINLNFIVSASDPDATTPTLSTSTLPSGASFINHGDGTGTFNWTPGFTQAGPYLVTFYASDGVLIDSERVTITVVEAGNQDPVLATIGAKSITEGLELNFNVSASDPDGTIPNLSTSSLPTGASFIDNGDGTGTFDWTPLYIQSGGYQVIFRASDGSASDSEVVTITVIEAGNQSPVLTAVGAQATTENVNLNFVITAADPDSTIPGLSSSTLPSGATFVNHGDGTGTFDWTPNYTQSGNYSVTFYATDGLATDSERVDITVSEAGNQPPVLASIGPRATSEGVQLLFTISATDPDATTPALSTSTLPTGASFTDNGNGTGDFDWTPDFTQSGSYSVTFYASDGLATDSEVVSITVNEEGNQAPVLAAIGSRSTVEGINLNFAVSASDADGTTPSFSTTTLPSGATFVDNGNGTGTFDWTPDFIQSGVYNVTFYATDGLALDSELVAITVNDAGNQLPVLAAIGAQSTTEGVALSFGISASDTDGPEPSLSTSALPSGAAFVDNGGGTGSFDWTPDFTQSGTYNITFYATDDSLAIDSEIVTVTVNEAGNQVPNLATIGSRFTTEGVNLNFGTSATDADGTTPSLSTSTLPAGAAFSDHSDGTGTFNWTPGYTQAGSYFVIFYASDGVAVDSEVVAITVNEAGNQNPVLATIGSQSTLEGVNLNFGVSAGDPDATTPALSTSTLPIGASFIDHGNGTGTFDWTPAYVQSGSYDITFYASDGAATDSELVTVTVNEAGNQPPILATIGARSTTEGVLLSFISSASDPDSTIPVMSTSVLPSGASFVDNGNGTGTFNWTPGFTQSGSHFVIFYASDGIATDSEVVAITVNDAGNQAPILTTIGSRNVVEGANLNFGITASDPDGTLPSLTTSTLPSGATFTDNNNGTGTFNWTPGYTQSGGYQVTFYAGDGVQVDSEVVTITVIEAGNQPPVLASIGARSVTEGNLLAFGVSSSDADGTNPALTTSTLPGGASFVTYGNGTGDFSWTPDYTQAGIYNVTFYASDGVAIDSEVVTITVNEAGNQTPILAAIGSKNTTEGTNLNFAVSATDNDGTFPTLRTSTLPSLANFIDNGDGTGSFDWTPDYTQAGVYNITFYADDGIASDSEAVIITVGEAGNQSPILATIGSRIVTENVNLNFNVSATDPDATIPVLSTSTLPSGALFIDNGNGTGTFDWTPGFTQSGIYNVTFYASDGVLRDSEVVTITVFEAGNQTPILATIGAQTVTEGTNLNFGVSATDPDNTVPSLSTTTLPAGAAFVDYGNGSGSFNWTPDFTQAGTYNVTFYATDGVLTDSEQVVITVNEAGNQAPVLAAIGLKATTEGVNLNFGVSATDADSTIPALSTSALPSGATFVDHTDGTATFDWTPDFTQAGTYYVTFYASDGIDSDSEVVTIAVNEIGNQAPVLATIGPRSTTENVNLNFNISATDPDGSTPSLGAIGLPSGATFINNGNGTGTFDWTPNFTQSGVYNVTFFATDGTLLDSEVVAITVNDAGNQDPVLAAIGARSTTEGVNLNFAISASDPDGTIPNLLTSTLPTGAVFTDNGNGTGSFNWTPGFTQAGAYDITFYASDGVVSDSEIVTITVNEAGNQPPTLAAIGARSTVENINLNFNVSATDPDSTIPSFSTSTLPTGASFTDNGNGTGTFNWTPNFTQGGTYYVTFYASDGLATDSEVVTISVNEAGNQEPILATIGARSTAEGVLLTFTVSASDPDETIPALTTSTIPVGASFVDNHNGTGSFNWTPAYTQAGSYFVIFYASDGIASDSEVVSITVTESGNQPPVLFAIGARSTTEGINLNFNISAADPDSTIPSLSSSTLPTGAAFINNGNGTGTFDWTPDFVQAGTYNITFYASDGVYTDSEIVVITVNESGNQPPVLATIGPRSTTEGINLNFDITATDPDATIPILSSSTVPTGAGFVDNGDGSGTFNWTPEFAQSGNYSVTFYASDGTATDSEVVAITVVEAGNQAPVLFSIGARSTTENVLLTFAITAADPDSTTPSLSTSSLPSGASFVNNGDGTGTFNWLPDFTQAGNYNVTFYASDGVLHDSELVTITVNEAGNQQPVLAAIGARATTENVQLIFAVSATDPDGTIPSLSTSTLPSGALFNDNGNGTGTFDWTPGFTQSGSYDVTFYASDGSLLDSEVVTVTVNESGNQAPVLAAIGPRSTAEGTNLNFNISASDPDTTIPSLSTSTLPAGAAFVDNGDGTGTFDWTPLYTQSGTYFVTFYASDGTLSDSEIVTISIYEAGNQTPVLAAIGPQSVLENNNLNFGVSATDPDGTTPVLTTSTLPTGASFVDNHNGTGAFDWTPDFTQSGTYNVTFYASDGVAIDSERVQITVNEIGNQSPVLAAIGPRSTIEGINLNFSVSASDPDETTPSLSTSTLPTGATFVDNLNGTGMFNWTPLYIQSGSYNVTFYASDGLATDSEVVTITVNEAGNQAPILAAIGARNTTENVNLTFGVSATDPDSTIPALSTSTLPAGANFSDNGNGSGTFDWTPDYIQSGTYYITFYATDDTSGVDSEIVTITVNEAGNQAPILATIGPRSTTEGINLNFGVSATDPDSTIPALNTSVLPTGASFIDNGDGTGVFDWTPGYTQSGSYNIRFYATDGSVLDSESVSITVNEAGNQPPVLFSIGPRSIVEGSNLNFGVSGADPDSTIPTLRTSILPAGASFTDHGNGTGTFNWTPGFTQVGVYDITFYASDGTFDDSEIVTITVNEAGNQPPVLSAIGPRSTMEGVNLNFTITASDPDSTIPTLSTSTLPTGATFLDNGDGSGIFDWTPDYIQGGTYYVTFYASDGIAIDSEIVTISVTEAGNQSPILATIGTHSTTEGVNMNFTVTATDPDSTTPVLTSSTLPSGAAYVDNHDGTATFDWTPNYTQSGLYTVTFYATDGILVDSETVSLVVIEAGNQYPVLAAIGSQTVIEGNNLNFGVSATDADSTIPSLSTSTRPTGAGFIDNGNGTGSFDWTPDFTQNGVYNVTFYASDGVLIDSEIVSITVTEAGNQAPILAAIGPQSITEGILLSFGVSATDADSTIPALRTSTLPTDAAFIDNGNGTGSFNWTPNYIQAGIYNVTFYADDGTATDSEVVTITVNEAGNQTPNLAAIGNRSVSEGSNLNFSVSATDPDSTIPALLTSTLPTGAAFVDNSDGTGTFDWTPNYTQAGVYNITFYADDGTASDSEVVTISVNEAGNQPPVLATIGPRSVTEGINLNFAVTSSDPDGNNPILSTSTLPTGATFVDNGDGTGTFDWTPGYTQSGVYNVTFYASDVFLIDSEVVEITINEAGNQNPVLSSIGAQSTLENVNLSFGVTAVDPDSTIPALSTSTLPTGAGFSDNGDGTGTFDWTPDYTQSGVYNVTFYATDDTAGVDSEIVTITVNEEGNQPPVLAAIGPQTTTENVNLSFGVSAVDPDSTIPALSTSTLPTNAVFTDNGNGTGSFNWTPDYIQSGLYSVTFYATDDSSGIDSEVVSITVNDAGNQLPILSSIGAQSTTENINLNFSISAVDPDSTIPALSTSVLPTNAGFTDHGDGTGTFDWTPDYIQSGSYDITFYATDDTAGVDSEIVTITVIDAGNQLPILTAIGAQTTTENINLTFGVSAVDPDSTIPVLSTSTLPSGADFADNGDGTGLFDWTPDFTQAGVYNVTFYATDDTAGVDSEVVTITVNEAGNQAPVLDSIGAQAVDEGVNLNFVVTASDADSTIPVLSTSILPTGASFTDNGDGSGVFDWTPDFTQSGVYDVTFYADDSTLTDSEVVTITVNHVNIAPTADAGPDQIDVFVNSVVTLDGSASSDFDSDPLTYDWIQVGGAAVSLSDSTAVMPTFIPPLADTYLFELTVFDGDLYSVPDTVMITAVNAAPPQAINDLAIAIVGDAIQLDWSEATLDTTGVPTLIGGYIIYRDTMAYFTPGSNDSIGVADSLTFTFTDNNIGGADVVGDTLYQYFYTVVVYDIYGNRSDVSNRVGEYDYDMITTASTDYNLICIPFENTGIATAVDLIAAIGVSNVLTVNNYQSSSQSFESRFAAGFGVNFNIAVGGIYQVNAAAPTTFSIAGGVPAPGTVSYQLVTTATTDFSFISVPFDREADFLTAQDVLDNLPGSFNTLNRYVAGSQSFESRFAAGFGVNFPVKAGKPYQANAANNDIFPGP